MTMAHGKVTLPAQPGAQICLVQKLCRVLWAAHGKLANLCRVPWQAHGKAAIAVRPRLAVVCALFRHVLRLTHSKGLRRVPDKWHTAKLSLSSPWLPFAVCGAWRSLCRVHVAHGRGGSSSARAPCSASKIAIFC